MEVLRLCAISVFTAVSAVLLKQYKSPLAVPVTLSGGCLLLFYAFPYLKDVFLFAESLSEKVGLGASFTGSVLKVVGITFITECTAALCKDAGEGALAQNLETAGKLIILGISLPLITSFFETVITVLP